MSYTKTGHGPDLGPNLLTPPPPPPAWLRSYFRVVWVAVIYVTLCVLGSVLLTFHVSAHIIPMKTLNSTYLSVGGETEAS